jgi:hypothetical protein
MGILAILKRKKNNLLDLFEIQCDYDGHDNEDKTIIPIDKIKEFKKYEKAINIYESTD